jgi:preprotein translocase subunit SecB
VQLIHDGKLQRAMHANGPAMLFGAAREIIRAATGRGPWSAVIIPSTNFLVGLPPLEAPAMAQDPTAAPAKKTVRKITRKPKTRQG